MLDAYTPVRNRQSHIFERQAEDWYVEPSWVWGRLFDRLGLPSGTDVLDPACGGGTCPETAHAAGLCARGSDIVARWEETRASAARYEVRDCFDAMKDGAAVVASNPPFKIAREFAGAAIEAAPLVALLLPCKWACGDQRARWLSGTPLSELLFLTPRPSMPPGVNLLRGEKPGGGTVDFALFVWRRNHIGSARVGWLHRDGASA